MKAFDRVPRDLLWSILERFGVPAKLINILRSLHNNINVKFTVDEITHVLTCRIGVKQGDILGPILFTFFIAAVMISWRTSFVRPLCMFRSKEDFKLTGRRPNAKGSKFPLEDSEYADDTAVLFESRQDLERFSPLLIDHFNRFGMEVHTGDENHPEKPPKTEVLFVAAPKWSYTNPSSYDNQNLDHVTLNDGKFLPVVDKFCYLGTTLSRDCSDNDDVSLRIQKAGNAFGSLRRCIFSQHRVSVSVKRTVYEGLILPILLYGAETWCLTKTIFDLVVRMFHHRCIRAMSGVTMKDVFERRLSTDDLLQHLNLRRIDTYITKRQLSWAGHVARMGFDRLPRKMLSCWVPEKRSIGAPEFTYGRGLFKSIKKAGLDKENWHVVAADRVAWRNVIDNVLL